MYMQMKTNKIQLSSYKFCFTITGEILTGFKICFFFCIFNWRCYSSCLSGWQSAGFFVFLSNKFEVNLFFVEKKIARNLCMFQIKLRFKLFKWWQYFFCYCCFCLKKVVVFLFSFYFCFFFFGTTYPDTMNSRVTLDFVVSVYWVFVRWHLPKGNNRA